MYKLIAIDLDGTLLNSYGEISEEDKNEIKNAISQGMEVVLTSGRTATAMENFAEDIGATNYLISGNGASIIDLQKKEIIYNKYLSKEKAMKIIKIAEENSMYYNIYTDKTIITKSLNYNTLFYYSENTKKPDEKKTKIEVVNNILEYIENFNNESILKITVCDNNENIFRRIMSKLKEIKNIDVLDVSHMSKKIIKYGTEEIELQYFYTEITNENVNKWTAIEYLINILNIKPEEVIAIGDNVNDIQMVKNSGFGVAMGHSTNQLKEIADFITFDNNSNGVANAIKKIHKM